MRAILGPLLVDLGEVEALDIGSVLSKVILRYLKLIHFDAHSMLLLFPLHPLILPSSVPGTFPASFFGQDSSLFTLGSLGRRFLLLHLKPSQLYEHGHFLQEFLVSLLVAGLELSLVGLVCVI